MQRSSWFGRTEFAIADVGEVVLGDVELELGGEGGAVDP
jgi:hypothetical protein